MSTNFIIVSHLLNDISFAVTLDHRSYPWPAEDKISGYKYDLSLNDVVSKTDLY